MSDQVQVKTRPVPRDELASFLPTPRLVRAFENMTQDVAETLPKATDAANEAASNALSTANAAKTQADLALEHADEALALVSEDTAPSLWVLVAELQKLRARVAALEQGTTS